MNSNELLEKARENIERHTELIESIEGVERAIRDLNLFELDIYLNGSYVTPVIMPDDIKKIQKLTLESAEGYLTIKKIELEQLLGIQPVPKPARKPATINPEFEAATKDMFEAVQKPRKEEEPIGAADKSLDKYPAKKKKKSPYPENMTPELVRKMYIDEGKTLKQLAEHFGLKSTQVNGFLIKHNLFRGSYNKDKLYSADADEKGRP